MRKIVVTLKTIFLLFGLSCCATRVSEKKVEKQAYKTAEVDHEGTKSPWLSECMAKLTYLKDYTEQVPELNWDKKKKEEILKLTFKTLYENALDWMEAGEEGVSDDNGKRPVNIIAAYAMEMNNAHKDFILADGEVDVSIEWQKNKETQVTRIKSWNGLKEGIERTLSRDDAVCLTAVELKSWGMIDGKDVVVVAEDANKMDGCYQFLQGDWIFMGAGSAGSAPNYTIIMWEESGIWKSAIRSKVVDPLGLDEICQVLGEEWGAIKRMAPPPPLLRLSDTY